MATGPGSYDDAVTHIREKHKASTVIVIVMGGDRGEGFDIQSIDPQMPLKIPHLLRGMAAMIEEQQQN